MKIGISLVTYNSAGFIIGCLDALVLASEKYDVSICVVDNASKDDTVTRVTGHGSAPTVIETGANLGYAGGNNRAFEHFLAQEPRPDVIFVINPDLTVAPGALDALIDTLCLAPDIGIVGTYMVSAENPTVAFRPYRTVWGRRRVVHLPENPLIYDTDRLVGALLGIRTEALVKAGPMREEYFLYWEEIEFCHRYRDHGYRIALDPRRPAIHDAEKKIKAHRLYYLARNQFLFARHRYSLPIGLLFILKQSLINNVRDTINCIRRGQSSAAVSLWVGWFAGLFGETGPASSRFARPRPANPS